MENIISYAQKQFETFEQREFDDIDSLIMSWLSYIWWPIAEGDEGSYSLYEMFKAECFDEMVDHTKYKEETLQLLTAVVASPRYRGVRIQNYYWVTDDASEQQFAAMTFQISDELAYVAYRGTDSSFVGWKEDFNMVYQYPIPSQKTAAGYLEKICQKTNYKLLTGGHSKGGNLAVYAAANNTRYLERILKVYCHDGPGFLPEVMETEGFKMIEDKVYKTVPQSSIFGMLLDTNDNYQIVKSNEKSVWQHNPFSWVIEDGQFCQLEKLTNDAILFDHTLNCWLATVEPGERERFIDTIYNFTDNLEVDNFLDFGEKWPSYIPSLLGKAKDMDKETRDFMFGIVGSFIQYATATLPENVLKLLIAKPLEALEEKED